MPESIFSLIEKAPQIAIFRHTSPDMDAFGSQNGLALALKHIWPEKSVVRMGADSFRGIPMDEARLEPGYLAVILDTGNSPRIDGEGWKEAEHSIRIDHHVPVEEIAETEWIDDKASATSEMLALFFKKHNLQIGPEAAQWLYQGLTADNLRFTTGNVRPETFEAAAYLLEQGANLQEAEQANFSTDYPTFRYDALVAQKALRLGNFQYAVMETADWLQCGLNFEQAKQQVFPLAGVIGIEVWALFTRMEDEVHYQASLRSREADVRSIAAKYNGGGHVCAAGIKNLSAADVAAIIQQLHELSLA